YAITEWAPSLLEPGRALTLYMMDHGDNDQFFVNGVTEVLDADELNGWLSEVEQAVDDVLINVVIEACRAGSFIQRGQSISGPGRVIVTSTSALAPAYASARGAYFSDAFLSVLASDLSVASAFFTARWSAYAAHPGQDAWLDDNGDGRYTTDDGRVAAQRGFGDAGTFPGPVWQPPLIEWAEATWDSSGEGVLRAQVRADSNIEAVAVLIYPPDFVPPEDGQELVQPVPPVQLLDGNNDGIFVAQYDGFIQPGAYRIVFTAVDEDGQPALPVTITRGAWPVYLPAVTR
ncbi:MAG: hypothetical protein IAE85_07660, partial [Anaerolinea sp.]|nr:hypothetical protein [Anaerolinea sp.]